MGFELPWALLGLLAAGVPVLVHLMRKRDLPVIALPTIALLRRAAVDSRRRMRLVDLLLLLLRVLLLALLAFAAARPFTTVEVAWGSGRLASVAIVVDDSMSMMRGGDGGLLRQAVARARTAVASLPSGSQVAIVLAGDPARVLVELTQDLDRARAALDRIPETTARGTNLPAAVAAAARELGGARHDDRRLLVLSDFARHGQPERIDWPNEVLVEASRLGGTEVVANRAVTEVLTTPEPTTTGRVALRATIRAFPPTDEEVEVMLVHEGRPIDKRRVALVRGVGRTTLEGPLVVEGDATARVEIASADRLPIDDRRGVLLRAPAALRVLIVDGEPQASRHDDEVGYLARALDAAPANEGVIAYRIVDADSLPAQSLDGVDAIVLANVHAPTLGVVNAIRQFVDGGGGLLVTAGRNVDPRAYAARFEDLLPTRLAAAAPLEGVGLRGRAERNDTGLGEVRTQRRLLLERPAPGARTTFTFADGSPAMVEGTFGSGRTAVFATTIDDDWTDLPYRPGFLPFVVETLKTIAPAARMPERPHAPGEAIRLPIPRGSRMVRITGPDGTRSEIEAEEGTDAVVFEATDRPGAYRVEIGAGGRFRDEPRIAFLVAPPSDESDLTPGEPTPTTAATSASESEDRDARRIPLHPWALLLAALVLFFEGMLRTQRPSLTAGGLQPPSEGD